MECLPTPVMHRRARWHSRRTMISVILNFHWFGEKSQHSLLFLSIFMPSTPARSAERMRRNFLVLSNACALCYAVESSDRTSLAEIVRLIAWRRVARHSLFFGSKEADSMWRINVTLIFWSLCVREKSSYWTSQQSNNTVPGSSLSLYLFFFF